MTLDHFNNLSEDERAAYLLSCEGLETTIKDNEALETLRLVSRLEGIIPALESSHAIAYSIKIAKNYSKDDSIIVNLSGRGDKDIDIFI